jgi:hypothetical protein
LIVHIATLWEDVYPNSKFVAYLIDHHLTEVSPAAADDGDIVVYFAGAVPKHAGRVDGSSIVSKWGTAHLWRHRLFEVPAAYGETVRFFRAINSVDSKLAFVRFAQSETGETFLPKD